MQTLSIPAGSTNIQFSVKGAGGGGGLYAEVGTAGVYQVKSYTNAAEFTLNIYVAQGGQVDVNSRYEGSGGSGGWGYANGGYGGDGEAYDAGCGFDWADGGAGGGGASAVILSIGTLLVEAAGGNGGSSDDWDGDCDLYYGGGGGSGGGSNVPTPPTSYYGGSAGGNLGTAGTNGQVVVTYDNN